MTEKDNGEGEQLAHWLAEAGRRSQPQARGPLPENGDDTYNSPASLHRYLEELAHRKLQTHAEVLAYLREVAGSQPEAQAARERRRMVREIALLVLLAISYLHYYYWDVQLQIAALKSVNTFIPSKEARAAKRTI
jgi:choline dehydrogenase-like flavoprotein